MRAVWYEQCGAPDVLRTGDVKMPCPAAGEVLVRVRASGVNPSDVKTRAGARGKMAFARQIPHSDGAGVVTAIGAGVSADRVGERVWLWNAAIGRPDGSCAEYVALPANQAVGLDAQTGFHEGACFGVPLFTAVHGVYADGDVEGKTVVVSGGAGAVGFYAVQAAKLGGATVITTVSNDDKRAHVLRANPDCVVNYKTDNVAECVADFTGGKGADRIVEVEFGGNLSSTVDMIRTGGVIAAYGSMADAAPRLPFYPLMFKNITVRMFLIYGIDDAARADALFRIKKMEPQLVHAVAKVIPLEQIHAAHEIVESGRVIGNVVVDVGGEES